MHPESYCSFCFKGVLGDRPTFMRLIPTFMQMPDQRVMPPVSLYKLLLMNESVFCQCCSLACVQEGAALCQGCWVKSC